MTEPKEFEATGAALWHSFADLLDLDPAETEALRQACHTADELSRIQFLLGKTNPLVQGSMGQPRINPLLAEARNHRRTLFRLLAVIKVPTQHSSIIAPQIANILSLRAKTAANARWSRRRAGG
jgi:hypothetical protein